MKDSRPRKITKLAALDEFDITEYLPVQHKSSDGVLPLLTVREVASLLRVSKNSVYELIHSGALAHIVVGDVRGIRIPGSEVERFISDAMQRGRNRDR